MVTSLDMTRKPARKRGTELAKAWLGVTSQVMTTEVATALGLEGTKGFRITRVLPASPAMKGGLLAGDILTKMNGEEIQAWRLQDGELLRRTIEDMDIDSEVTFTILRGGEEKTLTITLGETPGTSADVRKAEDEILEYKVRELTYGDRVDNHWPADMEGVLVGEVVNGGWANVAGLLGGDLLLTIQGESVDTIKKFKEITKKLGKDKPDQVVIFVRRDRATRFVFIEPEWPAK
jgi:serine protease Do